MKPNKVRVDSCDRISPKLTKKTRNYTCMESQLVVLINPVLQHSFLRVPAGDGVPKCHSGSGMRIVGRTFTHHMLS